MSTWNSVKTDKGLALESKMVKGATLTLTKCVSGNGIVPIVNLNKQTAVSGIKQKLSIQSVSVDNNKFSIRTLLTNNSVSTGYNLSQIGFYASDPDDGEILYAIAQITTPKAIPSNSDSPGYAVQFTFTFENSVSANINMTIDSSGLATIQDVNEIIDDKFVISSESYDGLMSKEDKKKLNTFDEIELSTDFTD